jgi:hypothetical protein
MKRARIALAAIAVFAIVGGVLATETSKAGKRGEKYVYIRETTSINNCTLASYFLSFQSSIPGQLATTTTHATATPGLCPVTTPLFLAD